MESFDERSSKKIPNALIDIFTVALKSNDIFIRIKDSNGNILYPLEISTLTRIDSILTNSKECTNYEKISEDTEVYDDLYNRYYKVSKSIHKLYGENYEIEFIEDISKRKYFETESLYDSKTEVYNDRAIMQKLENCIINSYSNNFSVIVCDIDDFKNINDRFTHSAGDFVLKELAKIFKNHVGNNGYVGRYGGDEFVFILKGFDSEKSLELVSNIISEIKSLNLEFNGKELNNISISCGIIDINHIGPYSISNMDDINEIRTNLFNKADIALYEVKENGKGQAIIYHGDKSNSKVYKKEEK